MKYLGRHARRGALLFAAPNQASRKHKVLPSPGTHPADPRPFPWPSTPPDRPTRGHQTLRKPFSVPPSAPCAPSASNSPRLRPRGWSRSWTCTSVWGQAQAGNEEESNAECKRVFRLTRLMVGRGSCCCCVGLCCWWVGLCCWRVLSRVTAWTET